SVKWPIDYVVGTLRMIKMKLRGSDQIINFSSEASIRDYLVDMGQTLLEPPSVFGWDWENSWISSSTVLARADFVTDIIGAHRKAPPAFRPARLAPIAALIAQQVLPATSTPAAPIVDAVTQILGVSGELTAAETAALVTYLGGPIDLTDEAVRNKKLNGLFALVME